MRTPVFGSFGNEPMQSCSVRHCHCWHHQHLCTALPVTQGSHSTWKTLKTWKNDSSFSSHGNIMEFENLWKISWKNERKPGKMKISVIVSTLFNGWMLCCDSKSQTKNILDFKSMSWPPTKDVQESKGVLVTLK